MEQYEKYLVYFFHNTKLISFDEMAYLSIKIYDSQAK